MKAWSWTVAMVAISVSLCFLSPQSGLAQSHQFRDDVAQLAADLHAGIDRSTLTEQQKAELRDDFKELRRAHQNHERFAAMRAARKVRTTLDSGAFRPEDRQRIEADMQAIREAHQGGARNSVWDQVVSGPLVNNSERQRGVAS